MTNLVRVVVLIALAAAAGRAQDKVESDYYEMKTVTIPDGLVLEVGGILARKNGSLLVCTRRGEVWSIRDPFGETPTFQRWADGLQEPLGLYERDGWVYAAQRGELTRMRDERGGGHADVFEVVCDDWLLSGSYHEYAFGPRGDVLGNLWVTLNVPFGDEPFGHVDWRGWAVRITRKGEMQPVCSGLRSPAGLECSPWGEMFYTDNQGEWCGASKLAHLEVGDFHGHPHGIESAKLPASRCEYPGEIPDGILMPEAARTIPHFKLPAVWFPYDKMGKSPSGFVWDTTDGAFGPFAGQVFVGDQHHASIMRCFLERVNGHWQGACFPFRSGFDCGLIRVAWSADGKRLIAGESSRGWGSKGNRAFGLQYLEWTREVPFEILAMSARSDGFRLVFTTPVDPGSVREAKFSFESYTYRLQSDYGSKEMDKKTLAISAIHVGEDLQTIDFKMSGLRAGYVHELKVSGLRSADGRPLLHHEAYYTLVNIPD